MEEMPASENPPSRLGSWSSARFALISALKRLSVAVICRVVFVNRCEGKIRPSEQKSRRLQCSNPFATTEQDVVPKRAGICANSSRYEPHGFTGHALSARPGSDVEPPPCLKCVQPRPRLRRLPSGAGAGRQRKHMASFGRLQSSCYTVYRAGEVAWINSCGSLAAEKPEYGSGWRMNRQRVPPANRGHSHAYRRFGLPAVWNLMASGARDQVQFAGWSQMGHAVRLLSCIHPRCATQWSASATTKGKPAMVHTRRSLAAHLVTTAPERLDPRR